MSWLCLQRGYAFPWKTFNALSMQARLQGNAQRVGLALVEAYALYTQITTALLLPLQRMESC